MTAQADWFIAATAAAGEASWRNHAHVAPSSSVREAASNANVPSLLCQCPGPLSNVTVDGNRGHSPDCPDNPRNMPLWRRECIGCGIEFETPIPANQPEGGYVCERCDG